MGNIIWGRFPQRVAERAAMRFTGMVALAPTSTGPEPETPRRSKIFRARFVLLFCATLFFIVGWWPLAVFFIFSAALSFNRRPK